MIKLSKDSEFPDHAGLYIFHFRNGKKYVGMTRNSIRKRILHHINAALAGRVEMPVRAALAKHGCDTVTVEVRLVEGDIAQAERDLIAHYAGQGVAIYNATEGGEGIRGFHHAPEVRAVMSERAKRTWTPERRAAASETLRRADVRERLVASQKRSWTPERRAAMGVLARKRTAKLTETTVAEIAALLNDKVSCAAIGRRYGVTPEAISAIKHGKNWSHVTGIQRPA